MTRTNPIAVALAALAAACVQGANGADPSTAPLFAADAERPELALLEHGLVETGLGGGIGDPTLCTTITRRGEPMALAPDAQLALGGRYGNVRGIDDCEWQGGRVVERRSGAEARFFTVHNVRCDSPDRCTGMVGWIAANLGAEYEEYAMTFADGRWRFEKTGLRMMS